MPRNDPDHLVRDAVPHAPPVHHDAEEQERALALQRGRERASGVTEGRVTDAWDAASNVAARAFVALAENVRDYAIFLVDPKGIITFWGEGARLIKWWTREEAEGGHIRLLYPAGGSEDGTAEDHLRQAAVHGEYTGEGHRVRRDGSTFWAGVTLTALWDADGTLLGFAKLTRDLTARRAADTLLQSAATAAEEARLAAEQANMAKSEFLATMSHEIRTPVNAIMGYLDLMSLGIGGPLTGEQRGYVDRAARGSRHLLALVSEVLDFSRLEAQRTPLVRRAFRIGDAVTSALGMVAPQARARGVDLSDAVSGYAGALVAWGDEARVTQIIVNLLVNAIKFTEPRLGQAGRIMISAGTAAAAAEDAHLSGSGPWVFVRVEDTGAGIDRDQMERIFEPFVQADMTLTRSHGGTGLGLAISRRLARALDGEVVARSEVGVGSTFLLWLPAAPLETMLGGGTEGQGLHADTAATDVAGSPAAQPAAAPGALRIMADALLGELEQIVSAYVTRMRTDDGTPRARKLTEEEIEDHFASFLADLASTLATLDLSLDTPERAVSDGTAIQRVISERHGAQRARLGWEEAEVRREYRIMREEIAAALQRRMPDHLASPTEEARLAEVSRAMEVLDQFLQIAESITIGGLRRAGSTG